MIDAPMSWCRLHPILRNVAGCGNLDRPWPGWVGLLDLVVAVSMPGRAPGDGKDLLVG
jgi:hypothetical protein